eukprot:Skav213696  [mRNA]  locus=scaffold491:650826:658730:- [translate_table: standard]
MHDVGRRPESGLYEKAQRATPSAELEFEEETDPSTFDDDATEAFDGIVEEIQKESQWEPSHFCAAPAQREVSRTVELYGLDEAGGPGSCLGGCLGALCGGLAALSQGASTELLHAGSTSSPSWAVKHAAGVLAREGSFDAEVVNFEFRRQCLQVHCDLEVLRQTAEVLTREDVKTVPRGGTAAQACRLAQKELQRGDEEAVKAREALSANELEVQNEQLSRYLLDLSWQKDELKAMLEHLQNHEAYAILGVEPEISDADLTKAYKAAAMRLHPDKGGNAEQFKARTEELHYF